MYMCIALGNSLSIGGKPTVSKEFVTISAGFETNTCSHPAVLMFAKKDADCIIIRQRRQRWPIHDIKAKSLE